MHLHGCQPDAEFLRDHAFGGRAPFLYGYLTQKEEDSAIMWCYRMHAGKRRNLLLIMAKTEYVGRLICPKVIETDFLIGNLSHGTATYLNTLEGFTPLRQSRQSKMDNSRVSLPAEHIVSMRRGEVTVFACHEGEWWVYRYD